LILRVGAGPRSAVCGKACVCGGCHTCQSRQSRVLRKCRDHRRPRRPGSSSERHAPARPPGPGSRRSPSRSLAPRRARGRASPRTKSDSRPTTVDIREPSVSPRCARGAEHTGSTTPAKPRRYAGAHGRDPNRSACSLLRTVLDLLALPPLTTASGSAAAQKLLNVATRASGAMRKGAENSRLLRSDSIPGHQGSSRRQRAHTQDQPRGHSQRRLDRERAIHSCCIKSSLGASSDRGTSTRSSACSSPM
jgi:hypothetical protein